MRKLAFEHALIDVNAYGTPFDARQRFIIPNDESGQAWQLQVTRQGRPHGLSRRHKSSKGLFAASDIARVRTHCGGAEWMT